MKGAEGALVEAAPTRMRREPPSRGLPDKLKIQGLDKDKGSRPETPWSWILPATSISALGAR